MEELNPVNVESSVRGKVLQVKSSSEAHELLKRLPDKSIKNVSSGVPRSEKNVDKSIKNVSSGVPRSEKNVDKSIKNVSSGVPRSEKNVDKSIKNVSSGVPQSEKKDKNSDCKKSDVNHENSESLLSKGKEHDSVKINDKESLIKSDSKSKDNKFSELLKENNSNFGDCKSNAIVKKESTSKVEQKRGKNASEQLDARTKNSNGSSDKEKDNTISNSISSSLCKDNDRKNRKRKISCDKKDRPPHSTRERTPDRQTNKEKSPLTPRCKRAALRERNKSEPHPDNQNVESKLEEEKIYNSKESKHQHWLNIAKLDRRKSRKRSRSRDRSRSRSPSGDNNFTSRVRQRRDNSRELRSKRLRNEFVSARSRRPSSRLQSRLSDRREKIQDKSRRNGKTVETRNCRDRKSSSNERPHEKRSSRRENNKERSNSKESCEYPAGKAILPVENSKTLFKDSEKSSNPKQKEAITDIRKDVCGIQTDGKWSTVPANEKENISKSDLLESTNNDNSSLPKIDCKEKNPNELIQSKYELNKLNPCPISPSNDAQLVSMSTDMHNSQKDSRTDLISGIKLQKHDSSTTKDICNSEREMPKSSTKSVLPKCDVKSPVNSHSKQRKWVVSSRTPVKKFIHGCDISPNLEHSTGGRKVEHSTGDQKVEHSTGDQKVEHSSGDRKVEHSSGDRKVEHPSGGRKVEHSSGGRKVEHSSGDRKVEHSSGDRKVEHSTGGQKVEDSTGGRKVEHSTGGRKVEHSSGGQKVEHSSGGQKVEHSSGGRKVEDSTGGRKVEHSTGGRKVEYSSGGRKVAKDFSSDAPSDGNIYNTTFEGHFKSPDKGNKDCPSNFSEKDKKNCNASKSNNSPCKENLDKPDSVLTSQKELQDNSELEEGEIRDSEEDELPMSEVPMSESITGVTFNELSMREYPNIDDSCSTLFGPQFNKVVSRQNDLISVLNSLKDKYKKATPEKRPWKLHKISPVKNPVRESCSSDEYRIVSFDNVLRKNNGSEGPNEGPCKNILLTTGDLSNDKQPRDPRLVRRVRPTPVRDDLDSSTLSQTQHVEYVPLKSYSLQQKESKVINSKVVSFQNSVAKVIEKNCEEEQIVKDCSEEVESDDERDIDSSDSTESDDSDSSGLSESSFIVPEDNAAESASKIINSHVKNFSHLEKIKKDRIQKARKNCDDFNTSWFGSPAKNTRSKSPIKAASRVTRNTSAKFQNSFKIPKIESMKQNITFKSSVSSSPKKSSPDITASSSDKNENCPNISDKNENCPNISEISVVDGSKATLSSDSSDKTSSSSSSSSSGASSSSSGASTSSGSSVIGTSVENKPPTSFNEGMFSDKTINNEQTVVQKSTYIKSIFSDDSSESPKKAKKNESKSPKNAKVPRMQRKFQESPKNAKKNRIEKKKEENPPNQSKSRTSKETQSLLLKCFGPDSSSSDTTSLDSKVNKINKNKNCIGSIFNRSDQQSVLTSGSSQSQTVSNQDAIFISPELCHNKITNSSNCESQVPWPHFLSVTPLKLISPIPPTPTNKGDVTSDEVSPDPLPAPPSRSSLHSKETQSKDTFSSTSELSSNSDIIGKAPVVRRKISRVKSKRLSASSTEQLKVVTLVHEESNKSTLIATSNDRSNVTSNDRNANENTIQDQISPAAKQNVLTHSVPSPPNKPHSIKTPTIQNIRKRLLATPETGYVPGKVVIVKSSPCAVGETNPLLVPKTVKIIKRRRLVSQPKTE